MYGGWDSNALDLPDGSSDLEYDLGADVAYGRPWRRGVFGISVAGYRQSYRQYAERTIWRGSTDLISGLRLSKGSVFGLSGGATYDYTDSLNVLNELGVQLPRTRTVAAYGEGRLLSKLGQRSRWLTELRYDRLGFESGGLTDTASFRARSTLTRRVGRRDELSASYEFLHTDWQGHESDTHSGSLGWGHFLSDRWSFEIRSGASRVMPPGTGAGPPKWLIIGGTSLSRKARRSSFAVSYRRTVTPGYGIGRLLFSDVFDVSVGTPLGKHMSVIAAAALDRSRDPFAAASRDETGWAELRLVTRLGRRLALVFSDRYRRREYVGQTPISGHRVGLALTSTFESRPADQSGGQPR